MVGTIKDSVASWATVFSLSSLVVHNGHGVTITTVGVPIISTYWWLIECLLCTNILACPLSSWRFWCPLCRWGEWDSVVWFLSWSKAIWGNGLVYPSRNSSLKEATSGTQGWSLRQDPQRNVSHPGLDLQLSYTPQVACLGTALQEWAGPAYINEQLKKWLTDIPTGLSDGGSSSTEVSHPQVCQINHQHQPS